MKLETLKLSDLKPAEYNPRQISKEEFEGLKESLETFGQQENLIVNKDMTIISGHQRYEAMKALNWQEAVCNMVDLDKHQEKKLNVIMNSTAISGKYDDLKLSEILEELKLDDDYEALRLDKLEPLDLSDIEVEEDEAPEVSSEPAVSKLGEVYQLGRHKIMCGDSTDFGTVSDLLDGVEVDIILTDPPYGMNAVSKSGVLSKTYKDDIMGDDDNTVAIKCFEITRTLEAKHEVWWGANYYSSALPNSECWIVWNKNNGGSDQTDAELAWGNMRSVVRMFTQSSEKTNRVHPTQKPVELPAWVFNQFNCGSIVLDLFLGSGSTLIACEQTDRICYGMELDPKYVDVIRKRYWKFINDNNEEGWQEGTPRV